MIEHLASLIRLLREEVVVDVLVEVIEYGLAYDLGEDGGGERLDCAMGPLKLPRRFWSFFAFGRSVGMRCSSICSSVIAAISNVT